jgi:hypothetical protein
MFNVSRIFYYPLDTFLILITRRVYFRLKIYSASKHTVVFLAFLLFLA